MYELQRQRASQWVITKDGNPVGYSRTKRDANTRLLELQEHDTRVAGLFRMAKTGIHEWTQAESTEIDELALALLQQRTRITFSGVRTIEDLSRIEHVNDAKTIEQWETGFATSEHGKEVCAELKHRRAARIEAFKRAGLTL